MKLSATAGGLILSIAINAGVFLAIALQPLIHESQAQTVEVDDELLTLIARIEQGNDSNLVLRTVTLDNSGTPILYQFRSILGQNTTGFVLTIVVRQDVIFTNGFDTGAFSSSPNP